MENHNLERYIMFMHNNRLTRVVIRLFIGAIVIAFVLLGEYAIHRYSSNRSVIFRTEGSRIEVYRNKEWQNFIISGVKIEAEKLAGMGISANATKDEYSRRLKELAGMKVNVISLNTVLPPAFYQTFYEYNLLTDKPLYLLQGICLPDNPAGAYHNAFDDDLNLLFFDEIRRTIDIVHGKHGSGVYSHDVSPYVIGYVLGEGTDAELVVATNERNPNVMDFEGDYLYTVNASPYESWLAAVGNYVISYEQDRYGGASRLVSWNTGSGFDQIKITEKFDAGILAFVHLRNTFSDYYYSEVRK